MRNVFRQPLTLWPPATNDGYGGAKFTPPQNVKGRWEERQEQFLDNNQQMRLSKAIVFLPDSTEGVAIGGYLYNGTTNALDPTALSDAFEILQVLRTPDLRNVRMELRVIL